MGWLLKGCIDHNSVQDVDEQILHVIGFQNGLLLLEVIWTGEYTQPDR